MVTISQDRGIAIFGRKRYGKTTLLHAILKEMMASFTVIVYNTNYETAFDDLKGERFAVLKPDMKKVGEVAYISDIIKRLRSNMNNFVFVIIDFDRFFEGTGTQTIKAAELKDLYGTGGHQRILPIIESKAPKYLPPKVIDNNNLFYIGQFKDLDNQKRLRNYATAEELSSLDRHQFIEVDDWTNKRALVEVRGDEIIKIKDLADIYDKNIREQGKPKETEREEWGNSEGSGEREVEERNETGNNTS